MGFDLAGATFAAGALIGNKNVRQSALPYFTIKSIWRNQIEGAYNLIFPLIHQDFCTKEESNITLKTAFAKHDMSNFHNGEGSTPGNTAVPEMTFIPKESMNNAGLPIRATGTLADYGV